MARVMVRVVTIGAAGGRAPTQAGVEQRATWGGRGRACPTHGQTTVLVAVVVLIALILAALPAAAGTRGLIRHGPRGERSVALTFDADMTPAMRDDVLAGVARHYDPRIVALLRRTGTSATIFLTGLWAEVYPGVARSLAADPLFELANHSRSHLAFREPCYGLAAATDDAARTRQVIGGCNTIAAITGVTTRWFRFPGGCHAASDVKLVRALDQVPVQWDVVSGDAFQDRAGVIVRTVLERVRPGSIVVMHLVGAPNAPRTWRALRRIIPQLRADGYRLVTLSELLAR